MKFVLLPSAARVRRRIALVTGVGLVAASAAALPPAPAGATSPAGSTEAASGVATVPPIDSTSRESVRSAYQNVYVPHHQQAHTWTGGNVSQCAEGRLGAASLDAALTTLNFYREMAGVRQVTSDATANARAQRVALLMDANDALSHHPPRTWRCWTSQADADAAVSALALSPGMPGAIDLYINDPGAQNTSVGHRAHLLAPDASVVGIGGTPAGAAFLLHETQGLHPGLVPWPSAGYFPTSLLPQSRRWSITTGGASTWDLSGAEVTVLNQRGVPVPVTVLDNMPGRISFEPSVSTADGSDTRYTVIIDDVTRNGAPASYSYTVTLFDASRAEGTAEGEVNWSRHPTVTGTPAVGEVLAVDVGEFTPRGVVADAEEPHVTWWHTGTGTQVGQGATYQVTPNDAGRRLTARVAMVVYGDGNAEPTTGTSSAVTDKVGAAEPTHAPQNSAAPTISGDPAVGSTLTADPGAWTGAPSYTYQWFRGAAAISGAVGRTYRPAAGDAGAHLRVRVTGSNSVGSTFAYSSSFGPIEQREVSVVNEVPPSVKGASRVGQTLRVADPGTWSVPLDENSTVTYYWFRNDMPFSNSHPNYRLQPGDLGDRIRVAVAVTRDDQQGYADAGTYTIERGVAAKPKGRAAHKGTGRVGTSLKGIPPKWNKSLAAHGITLRYQWLRNGKVVSGRTSRKYRLTRADRGTRLVFRVKAVWPGHLTGVSTSRPTRIR